jgi:hypothetical protein
LSYLDPDRETRSQSPPPHFPRLPKKFPSQCTGQDLSRSFNQHQANPCRLGPNSQKNRLHCYLSPSSWPTATAPNPPPTSSSTPTSRTETTKSSPSCASYEAARSRESASGFRASNTRHSSPVSYSSAFLSSCNCCCHNSASSSGVQLHHRLPVRSPPTTRSFKSYTVESPRRIHLHPGSADPHAAWL